MLSHHLTSAIRDVGLVVHSIGQSWMCSRLAFLGSCRKGICWTTTAGDLFLGCRLGSWYGLVDGPVADVSPFVIGLFCWLILQKHPQSTGSISPALNRIISPRKIKEQPKPSAIITAVYELSGLALFQQNAESAIIMLKMHQACIKVDLQEVG